jgi:hypothetical protein
MFAGWSHERERRMVRILPVLPLPCQGPICLDFLRKPAIQVSISPGRTGCMTVCRDVHCRTKPVLILSPVL